MNVRFFAGTRAQYDALPSPRNPLGLYFCEDTNELFWADRLLTDGMRVVATVADLPAPAKAADGVVYYITETRNGYVVPHGSTEWVQTIYAPVTDAYEVPESEIYNTVTTVGAVRDIEAKIYAEIDERIANIEIGTSGTGVKTISIAGIEFTEVDGVFTLNRVNALEALGFILPEGLEESDIEVVTKDYVDEQIAKISETDLSNYYNKSEVEALIPDVSGFITTIPEEYVTDSELTAKGYLTEHQSLEGYATEQWVENKNYLTEHQDISGKADKDHKHDDLYEAKGAAEEVKNDLLNGAGDAYDTLKELGEAIDANKGVIDSLREIATSKAEKDHEHSQYLTELPEHTHDEYLTELPEHTHSEYLTELPEHTHDEYLTALPEHSHDEYLTELPEHTHDQYLTEHQSLDGKADKVHEHTEYADKTHGHLLSEITDYVAPEIPSLDGYATEKYVDDAIAGIKIPSVEGLATIKYVDEKFNSIKLPEVPEVDLSGYYTKEETNTAISDAVAKVEHPAVDLSSYALKSEVAEKANEVPFITAKFVTKPFGDFKAGDDVNGLTVAQLFAKLLGLSDAVEEPDEELGIVDTIISKQSSVYQADEEGNLLEVPYTYKVYTPDEATQPISSTGFYQIKDGDTVIESGYEHYTEPQEMFYMVALPNEIIIGENAELNTWDVMSESWVAIALEDANLTCDIDEITTAFEDNGLEAPTAAEGYTLWAKLDETNPGCIYRIIIREGE